LFFRTGSVSVPWLVSPVAEPENAGDSVVAVIVASADPVDAPPENVGDAVVTVMLASGETCAEPENAGVAVVPVMVAVEPAAGVSKIAHPLDRSVVISVSVSALFQTAEKYSRSVVMLLPDPDRTARDMLGSPSAVPPNVSAEAAVPSRKHCAL